MDIKLSDYQKKDAPREKLVGTGVSITEEQKAFVDKNNVNVSKLLRDVLAQLMGQNNKESVKRELVKLLTQKWRQDPEDESLAEYIAEIEGGEYSETEMRASLAHEKGRLK